MKTFSIIFYSTLLFVCFTSISHSQEQSIQLSLFNPIQIVPEHQSISGFRSNLIYGKNANVTGFDLGLVNHSTGLQNGVQFGGVNVTDGGVTGWQAGFVNISNLHDFAITLEKHFSILSTLVILSFNIKLVKLFL